MNSKLRTEATLADPDGFYAKLIEMHQGLTREQSDKLNAKLILILANQVGDDEVLAEVLEQARRSLGG